MGGSALVDGVPLKCTLAPQSLSAHLREEMGKQVEGRREQGKRGEEREGSRGKSPGEFF